MVPDKFNIVDMGGIDLILMQGESVPGLYDKLMAAISNCQYQCLYNWLFDGVLIPPTYVQLTVVDGEVYLNEGVSVTSDDVIHIYSIDPGPVDPEIIPLLAEENGVYNVPAGKDGFNPVTVDVPSYTPVINPITITENGIYNVTAGVDGYAPVTVNVSGGDVLPDGYTALAYIESDGTQYIDTGVSISGNIVIDCEFSLPVAPSDWHGFLGGGNGNANSSFSCLINGLTTVSFQHGTNSFNDVSFPFILDTHYKIHFAHGFAVGDVYYPFINFSSSSHCMLFRVSFESTSISAKVYSFDLYTGTILARHMVPAMRDADSEIGMYDFISESFFTNAGTGTFLYG